DLYSYPPSSNRVPRPFPTRRSSDLGLHRRDAGLEARGRAQAGRADRENRPGRAQGGALEFPLLWRQGQGLVPQLPLLHEVREGRSEEHTSELQSRENLVCRLLLETK